MDRSTGNTYNVSKEQKAPGIERRRFRPYPRYKDSGVEWLGKIPAHWEARPLKYVAPLTKDRINRIALEIPYIGLEQIESRTGKMVRAAECGPSEEQAAEGPDTRFRSGDVLFGKLRPYLAKVLLSSFDGRCSSEFLVLRSGGEISPAFLAYQLLSPGFIAWINALTYGTKMPRASPGQVMSTPIAIPDADEQIAISAFLDRETAKIDALIEKKERLIELLQEKRTALITQAVTKGLDPTVPMKDSGVEWLGKIPKHWDLVPLKRCVRLNPDSIKTGPFGSQLLAADMQGEDIKVYNQRTVIDLDFLGGDGFISFQKFHELKAFEVYPDDVLVTTRGTIGRCAIVPENAERGILHPCLMRIQLDRGKLIERFLALLIQESYLVKTQLGLASNATTIDVIYSDTMRQVLVPKPPISEQVAILKRIDERVAEISRLVEMVSGAIDRLKEYHTALISAAVTGKIDARELARFDNNISPLN